MLKRKIHIKVPVVAWAESWALVEVPPVDQGHSLIEQVNADPDALQEIEENLQVTSITGVRWLDMEVVD